MCGGNWRALALIVPSAGLFGTPAAAPAQRPLVAQQFLDEMAKVRDQVQTAHFELSGQKLITAESRPNSSVPGRYFPVKDARGDLTYLATLDFVNNRFRTDFTGIELFANSTGTTAAPVRKVRTYDGQKLFMHVPKGTTNERWFEGSQDLQWEVIEQKGPRGLASVFFEESYPMLFACGRMPSPGQNYRIDARSEYKAADFQFRGNVTVEGVRCALLRYVLSNRPAGYWDWFVDVKNLSRIVKFQKGYDGRVLFDLEIRYDGTSRVPKAWKFREFDNDNPKRQHMLSQQWNVTVTKAEINTVVSDAVFQPNLAPNMLVATDDGLKRVAKDGHSLKSVNPRFATVWYLAGGIVGTVLVVGVILLARKRRRRRADRPEPTSSDRLSDAG